MSRGKRKQGRPQEHGNTDESTAASPNSAEMPEIETAPESTDRRAALLKLGIATVFLLGIMAAVLIATAQNGDDDEGRVHLRGIDAVEREFRGIPQGNMVIGDPAIDIGVFEFGDLQCLGCKYASEEVIPDVIKAKVRDGESRLEFVNHPIIGAESVKAARAALAAGAQRRGWNFVSLFYLNQGVENSGYVTDEFLTSIAKAVGVKDIARWNRYRKSPAPLKEIKRARREAKRLGFRQVPEFGIAYGESGMGVLERRETYKEMTEQIEYAIDKAHELGSKQG